jgi:CBS domain containing-hemolysin-like protein
MFTFEIIVTILIFVALVMVSGMKPMRSSLSHFEMKRQARQSSSAKAVLVREQRLADIEALLSLKASILLVLLVVMMIVTFGWALGIILSVLAVLSYLPLARTAYIKKLASRLYTYIEPQLLRFVQKFSKFSSYFSVTSEPTNPQVHSKQEFQELIERSGSALTSIERKVIVNALDFNEKIVSSIMTPKSVIDFINKGEFLGPLVLDELHDLGHSRLPVIDGDLDHVVGILYLRDFLSLDVKRSGTAEKVMDTHVYYIREDQTLEHALAAFLKNRHHMFIVINQNRETVGLLTIEDTIEALLGRRIVDEDDNHADLRSVAEHRGVSNNNSTGHIDV